MVWAIAVLAGLGLLVLGGVYLMVDYLWFQEVGYVAVFARYRVTQALIGLVVTGLSLLFLLPNLMLARRLKYPVLPVRPDPQPKGASRATSQPKSEFLPVHIPSKANPVKPDSALAATSTPLTGIAALSSRWLFLGGIGLSVIIALLLWHYGQVAVSLSQHLIQHPDTAIPVPNRLRPEILPQLGQLLDWGQPSSWLVVGLLGFLTLICTLLLVYPAVTACAIALVLSLVWGFILMHHWETLLQALYGVPFERVDPLFSRDIGFYLFRLPLWQLLEFWLGGLLTLGLVAVALIYLTSGNSLSQGTFSGFTSRQWRHLSVLTAGFMLVICLSHWLRRFELLYSRSGVVYGAGYVDAQVLLPAHTGLSLFAAAIALWLLWRVFQEGATVKRGRSADALISPLKHFTPYRKGGIAYLGLVIGGYLLTVVVTTLILPPLVQRLGVQPNELARETPYIRHNIALTREGFDLKAIEVETFDPQNDLTYADLQENALTVRNIRLWDTRPLLQTNRQLQQIRPYYRFPDADIDRYTLSSKQPEQTATGAAIQPQTPNPAATEKQQVLIAARELDFSEVPPIAQTWVNQHLIYTHGYGFTLSPVNQVGPGGLPDYFVKDIGVNPSGRVGGLTIASEQIRNSIPISQPRIYYGELTNTYVMVDTRLKELDYPSGNENVYNTYDGSGGISIGSYWRRLLFSVHLRDWQMLLTRNFKPQTRLLYRRAIMDRVRHIAPFLHYDQDPYLVIADAGHGFGAQPGVPMLGPGTANYLYWIVDAYTVSNHYPYSDPSKIVNTTDSSQGDSFNYIRNPVKVIIDAYNGSVHFYVADPQDPIIKTWQVMFPGMLQPLSAMPASLHSHIRYPVDLFQVQSERLLTYHMTDPQVFYNREDLWQIPNEIYGSQLQPVEPYFLITQLPNGTTEEFILILPFTPSQRSNLIAWMAARSDGVHYGKVLQYQFPKERLVFGSAQIEARINQDPVISQQISLWNREGSRAVQGNLLVIPIEQSLLYVEPLYLEAEANGIPTLVRVIAAFENRIAMSETLDQSLKAVFQEKESVTPAIVRPVE